MYAKYRDFKTFFESERYFEFVDIKCFRDHLVKLRLGLLPVNNSVFSSLFSRDTPDGCDYCGEFEDEKYLICFCPLYENIKVKCNGAEWSKDKTQAAESIKWRPQQAYGSNQFLLVQPQTVFSTHKILTLTHR